MDLVEQIRQEGWQAGRQEERHQNTANFKAMGVSLDIIHQATGLSLEEISQLEISDTTKGTLH
ncbi:MAG: hypothetical protein CSA21_02525 [Deltaproteobacteria bacterium]|nr:MAG: hypothetical protein CSA21_02525 [Deltaproteobacteria bacterium]